MEDASAFRPVSVQATGIKETVTLLEEEVVSNQLILLSFGHAAEGIESTSKLSLESVAGLYNLLLNGNTLLTGDSRAQREVSEVAADTDSSRFDHSSVFWREGRALQLPVVHIADVASVLSVTMVLFNNTVHQRSEGFIGLMTACIDTDS